MKTLVCLSCATLLALPSLQRAGESIAQLQDDVRRNLACTAAIYAALDADATEDDFARAEARCDG